jgi:hypothetical protein
MLVQPLTATSARSQTRVITALFETQAAIDEHVSSGRYAADCAAVATLRAATERDLLEEGFSCAHLILGPKGT